MKGVLIRPFYAFFMKILQTITLLTALVSNAVANYTQSGSATITTVATPIQQTTVDNGILQEGNYYYLKQLNQEYIEINTNKVYVRGYQYTHTILEDNEYSTRQIIDYYILWEKNDNTTFANLKQQLQGSSIDTPYSWSIDEYYYQKFTDTDTINQNILKNWIKGTQFLYFSSLNDLRTRYQFTDDTHANVNAGQNYNIYETDQNINIYRIRLEISFLGNTDVIDTSITQTANLYQEITTTYTWSGQIPDGYEVIDIPGLIFTILGMPFAWVSTAFNLTLFPGTPYAINISHLFFAVVFSLLLIIILKKVIK